MAIAMFYAPALYILVSECHRKLFAFRYIILVVLDEVRKQDTSEYLSHDNRIKKNPYLWFIYMFNLALRKIWEGNSGMSYRFLPSPQSCPVAVQVLVVFVLGGELGVDVLIVLSLQVLCDVLMFYQQQIICLLV